ncbi:MAG: hypothetical protein RLZZ476_37 [Verrucomicrobiota bacterium]|jgi:hypothetical protein
MTGLHSCEHEILGASLAKTTGTFSGYFNHSSGGKAAYNGTILQKGANSVVMATSC